VEHISTIVQDALDRAAEQIEREAPLVAEQIRETSERIDAPIQVDFSERVLSLVV
jgi:hypothetical protein